MKPQKSKKILVGALAVATLMCIATVASAMQASEHPAHKIGNLTVERLNNPAPRGMGLQGNVRISTYEGDNAHPAITTSGGRLVAAYQQVAGILDISDVIATSTDGGESWQEAFGIAADTGLLQNPDITYNSATDQFFYTTSEPQAGYGTYTYWFLPDMSDLVYGAAWSNTGTSDSSATTVGQWMVIPYVADDYQEDGMGLFYLRLNPDTGEPEFSGAVHPAAGSYYDGESITDTSPAFSLEIDSGSERMYFVIEHPNDETGMNEIIYKETYTSLDPNSEEFLFIGGGGPGGMDKHADIEVWPFQGILKSNELYQYEDPDVATSGSMAAVVYQTTENNFGDYDIHCTYTADNGETWETSVVADNHPEDDTNPAIYMSGSNAYCVFVSDGNLYLAESEDGGATWGEPEQINNEDGTVVAEEDTADIDAGGMVWTDNRDGAKNIYYSPLPAPNIGVDSIGGVVGVTATISNTGTVDATDVAWTISLSGPVFVGSEASGTIATLAAGDTTTVSTGFVLGIGPTTITVNAGGASGTASGFVLGPLVLGL